VSNSWTTLVKLLGKEKVLAKQSGKTVTQPKANAQASKLKSGQGQVGTSDRRRKRAAKKKTPEERVGRSRLGDKDTKKRGGLEPVSLKAVVEKGRTRAT